MIELFRVKRVAFLESPRKAKSSKHCVRNDYYSKDENENHGGTEGVMELIII